MGRTGIWLVLILQLLLAGCGGGSDDGPVKGTSPGGGNDPTTTSFFLNVSLQQTASAMTEAVARQAAVAAPAVPAPFSARAVSNLGRNNFDAVVLVEDSNAQDGFREVPVGIASFESFGNGVYRVDIDGLPQVNGVIYVTIGSTRLVFLMLRVGTRAEPVDINPLTSATDKALIDVLKTLPAFPAISFEDVRTAREDTLGCLEGLELDTTGIEEEDLEAFYQEQMELYCPLPDLGEVDTCAEGEGSLCTVGGTLEGVSGSLTLLLNDEEQLTVTSNGPFAFASRFRSGDSYDVIVASAPTGQECTVTNGTGTIDGESVENVQVICLGAATYTIGGTVNGLSGTLQLALNELEVLTVTADGAFVFEQELALGNSYSVAVAAQPSGQSCTVESGSGEVASDVTSIVVSCSTVQLNYLVGGTVSGLEGQAVLSLNQTESLTLTQNGGFTFEGTLTQGSTFLVTLVSSPANQSCALTGNSGTVGTQNIDTVQLSCTAAPSRQVSGTVAGLAQGINLTLNGTETLSLQQNGSFSFSARFLPQDSYSVAITGVSGGERCLIANASGTFANGDAAVTVQCSVPGEAVSAGNHHSCATQGGEVRCWGDNRYGALGEISPEEPSLPSTIEAISTAVTVVSGDSHSCALLQSGAVRCWGRNDLGQTATTSEAPLATVPLPGIATAIAASANHTCVVLANGEVFCWGNVGEGGEGASDLPISVSGIQAQVLAAGDFHICALVTGGTVQCWGKNGTGQLGDGTTEDSLAPVTVQGLSGARTLAADGNRTCAGLINGSVQCWGGNEVLGPQPMPGLTDVITLALGPRHNCAVSVGGTVQCWGENAYGQLGNGVTEGSASPVDVSNMSTATAITVGEYHSCAALASGQIQCWGSNFNGQLDSQSQAFVGTFDPVGPNLPTPASVIGAGIDHNCALTQDGVYCWGSNSSAQLGNGTTVESFGPVATIPVAVAAVSDISVGHDHSCAMLTNGQVQCWGMNVWGQAGVSDDIRQLTPTPIQDISSAVSVAAGANFSCAALQSGGVQCWGNNQSLQLGDPQVASSVAPLTVPQLSDVIAVSAGDYHACALQNTGQVRCWGANNNGQLGDGGGTFANSALPLVVAGIDNAVAIDSGGDTSCALLGTGEMRCWGNNFSGQIGVGSSGDNFSSPQLVPLTFEPNAISVNRHATCAVSQFDVMECWGSFFDDMVTGSGNATLHSSPTMIVEVIASAASASAQGGFLCWIEDGGFVACYGLNDKGQLGIDPGVVQSALPLTVQFQFSD